MFLALPLAAGLIVGKLTGGSFRSLAGVQLRWLWLFPLGLAIQVVLYNPWTESQGWDIRYGHIPYLLSLLLLFAGLLVNLGRVHRAWGILAAGAALNLFVIAANGAAMPVEAQLLAQSHGQHFVWLLAHNKVASNVALAVHSVRFGVLDDQHSFAGSVYSFGDILIATGGFLVAIMEMHRQTRSVSQSLKAPEDMTIAQVV